MTVSDIIENLGFNFTCLLKVCFLIIFIKLHKCQSVGWIRNSNNLKIGPGHCFQVFRTSPAPVPAVGGLQNDSLNELFCTISIE